MPKTTPTDLARAQRISALCAHACTALAIGAPGVVATVWTFGSGPDLVSNGQLSTDLLSALPGAIQPWQRAAGALICTAPMLILSYGLLRARRSLQVFARGDLFSTEVISGLRDYAAASLWMAIASFFQTPLLSVALTAANAAGHRQLSIGLNSTQILGVLGAAIVWVIASAMAKAASIANENAQFV